MHLFCLWFPHVEYRNRQPACSQASSSSRFSVLPWSIQACLLFSHASSPEFFPSVSIPSPAIPVSAMVIFLTGGLSLVCKVHIIPALPMLCFVLFLHPQGFSATVVRFSIPDHSLQAGIYHIMLPNQKGLGRWQTSLFLPHSKLALMPLFLLYLNPSPEWEEEGAMAGSLSEAITGSYILGVIGRECRCPG